MGAWSASTSGQPASATGVGAAGILELLDKLTGGLLSGGSAISDATSKMSGSMDKASQQISDSTKEAMGYNAPYMNPEVFKRLSDLVTSGAFQTPFSGSYQPPAWNTPNMSINPNMGNFSMTPWSSGQPPPTYSPQGLPPGMAQMLQRPQQPPMPQQPPSQLPPLNPTRGTNIPVIVAHNAKNTSLPGPIPQSPLMHRFDPSSVLDKFRRPNPMTAQVPIPRVGSGPFVPGPFIPGGIGQSGQIPGGFNPGNPSSTFIPNNPSGTTMPSMANMMMLMQAMNQGRA